MTDAIISERSSTGEDIMIQIPSDDDEELALDEDDDLTSGSPNQSKANDQTNRSSNHSKADDNHNGGSNQSLKQERIYEGQIVEEDDGVYSFKLKDEVTTKDRHRELYRAALDGDWKTAKQIFKKHENDITASISKKRDTALHIAIAAKRTDFAKKIIEKIDNHHSKLLGMRNAKGNTPFCFAAASGSVDLARLMMAKKIELVGSTARAESWEEIHDYSKEETKLPDMEIGADTNLAMITGSNHCLPLEIAALFCQGDMVKFLYQPNSVKSLDPCPRFELFVNLISAGLYDVALDLATRHPDLATARDPYTKETALHILARIPMTNQIGFWKRCFPLCNCICNKKGLAPGAGELVKHLWKQVTLLDDSKISDFIRTPEERNLLFVTAEQGNIEFLNILVHEYPDLIFEVDKENYTIFHHAVKNRQEHIFKLIYRIGSHQDFLVSIEDKNKNNILHLAAMLPPKNQLNIVSGAALQLQRELLWFKKVRRIMNPLDIEKKNLDGKTPRALFTMEHEKLKKEGEQWMKDTGNSCMIVATLIATIVFAAAFTVPGGTKDTGTPNFLRKASFRIFAVSDAISLVSSSCSILTFLSILTSRYTEKDFMWHLPFKMIVGLATLFLSIVAMMVVFCATFFIVFSDGMWTAVLAAGLAPIPVILFIYQQFRIVKDLITSICLVPQSSWCKTGIFSANKGKATEPKKEK